MVAARYVSTPVVDQLLAMERGGSVYYFHTDDQGSVRAITDATGNTVNEYRYDSYGNVLEQSQSVENHLKYIGREFDDETGWYFFHSRYYLPRLGQYNSPDPMGFFSRDLNLYRYARGNPRNLSDRLGLNPIDPRYIEKCRSLLRRIRNVQERIQRRIGQLREDPLCLPETCPGDKLNPSLSRAGHRCLINKDKALLAALRAEYMAFCGGPPPEEETVEEEEEQPQEEETPQEENLFDDIMDWEYWEEVTGLTGGALLIYLIISEGSRLFPPRNLVPVP